MVVREDGLVVEAGAEEMAVAVVDEVHESGVLLVDRLDAEAEVGLGGDEQEVEVGWS